TGSPDVDADRRPPPRRPLPVRRRSSALAAARHLALELVAPSIAVVEPNPGRSLFRGPCGAARLRGSVSGNGVVGRPEPALDDPGLGQAEEALRVNTPIREEASQLSTAQEPHLTDDPAGELRIAAGPTPSPPAPLYQEHPH